MGQTVLVEGATTPKALSQKLQEGALERQIVNINNLGPHLRGGQLVDLPFVTYYVEKTTNAARLSLDLLLNAADWSKVAKKNGLTSDLVQAGQILHIPIKLASQQALEKDCIETYAQRGETLNRILQRYPGSSVLGSLANRPRSEPFKEPTPILLRQAVPGYGWQKLSSEDMHFIDRERERLCKLLPSSRTVAPRDRMLQSIDCYIELLASTSWLEGYIPCMYLDPKGLVTVGIGTNLEAGEGTSTLDTLLDKVNFYRCNSIQWAHREGEQNKPVGLDLSNPVPKEEVIKCFEALKEKAKRGKASGLPKTYFDPSMPYVLPLKDAKEVARAHIKQEADRNVPPRFKDYQSFPVPALVAILDMIYNLGIGTFDNFRKLQEAINANNWIRASIECHRKDWFDHLGKRITLPGLHSRNLLTRELFLLAAEGLPN